MACRVLVRHHVRDFNEWKKVFDAAEDFRRDAGETAYVVMTDADEPNVVWVQADFVDRKAAMRFLGKDSGRISEYFKGLLRGMQAGGVDEKPEVHIVDVRAEGTL